MGRERRVVGAGLRYHVMGHAVEGELLFRDDEDRWTFIRRTALVVQQEDAIVEAHSEMPNHFHLALLTRSTSISEVMHRIESAYSHYYNARYGRKGHLLRDRFLSKVISTADYWVTAVLYIHCNPLKAGIVRSLDELERYPFTGHAALMGRDLPWIQDLSVLRLFGKRPTDARRELRRQMTEALAVIPDDETKWFTDEATDARAEIERRVAERTWAHQAQATDDDLRRKRRAAELRLRWPLEDLVRELAHQTGVLKRDVIGSGRGAGLSSARAVICYIATRELGFSASNVAAALQITPAAVCQASRRGCAVVGSNPEEFAAFLTPRRVSAVAIRAK